jgi:5,10-methylenetetrahydromethanopterin reductase
MDLLGDPKNVGVVFPANAPAEDLPQFARRAEELGYRDLWLIEDCFLSGGLTLAATALAATDKLGVGIGLLPTAVRNAAIVSMEIATLATIHPGRLTVAFGHGVDAWMRQIDARPRNRVTALEEMVTAVKQLLAGGTVSTSGGLVNLDSVKLDRPPAVAPKILVGTTGRQGLRVARDSADGVLLPEGAGVSFIEQVAEQVRGRGSADDNAAEIVAYAWLRFGPDGPEHEALAAAVDGWREWGLFPAAIESAGADHASVIHDLAVTGDPARCAATVARMLDAGVDHLVLAAVGQDYVQQYESFAEHVLPLLTGAGDAA